MALTKDDVRALSDYARIALTSEELDEMAAYLNKAITLLDPIRAYDLAGVEPTYHPIGALSNVMATDEVETNERALVVGQAFANADCTQDNAFCVPSILRTDGGSS